MQITIVLGLLVLAIILFATEKLSVDIVTLLMLLGLTLTGIITPAEAFAGFGSDFIVILASVFVLGAALEDTGVLDFLISKLVNVASKGRHLLLFLVMITAGFTSAFMNNTTVTAMFLTPMVGVARKSGISASRILMPLAYASILGGTCTLIGTSTNVAVSGYLASHNMPAIGFFEFTGLGLLLFGVGIFYMMTIGWKLLPEQAAEFALTEEYNIQKYLTEILIMPESPLIGENIFTSVLADQPLRVLNVIRQKHNFLPDYRTSFEEGDIILVEGSVDDLLKIKEAKGIEIMADVMAEKDLQTTDIKLAEMLIPGKSAHLNRTVKDIDFMRRYGIGILAISRHGETLRSKINEVSLQLGDLLLVQGPAERLASIRSGKSVVILDEFKPVLFKKRKGLIVIGSFLLAILLGSLEVIPLSLSFMGAALVSVLLGCITTERAYEAIDWRLLILIGGMTAFGIAMEHSGAAQFLADGIVYLLKSWGPISIMAGFVLLTVFLTQPMSNAAAALVILPVALQTAETLDVNQRTFAIAIMLAASVSLVTPFEPSCILVYGPGKYKFRDFLKVGSGLTLVLITIIILLVPVFWPLDVH